MTAKTSRIIIKTFVRTALKDADESPERCTRNLVDMALHFSKGRFQQEFFEMARAMLNNDNSPYYSLIEDTLRHMDKEKLIEFGMNLGYNGCTQGAHIVRKIKRTENINVPWLFFLNIDSSYADLRSRYQAIFDQGKELGIYVYCLYTDGDPEKLLPLIEHNPDCAMILLCNSAAVTEDFAKAAESLNNMLIGVAYDDNTDTACLVLRDHRLLYSIYRMYTDTESDEILSVPTPASLKKCIARLSQSLPIPVAAHPSEKMSTRQWLVPVLPRNTVPFLLICFMISNESEILFHHLQA